MRAALVFPASSYRPEAFLAAADAAGIEVVLATDLPGAARRLGRECHRVDFADPVASARALALGAIDGAMAVDERSAVVAAALSPSYHSLEGVLAARDKLCMRERLQAAGVPCPRHQVVAAGSARLGAAATFPCVVKPAMLSGSQGVIRADDAGALEAAVGRVRRILHRHPSELRAVAGFFDLLVEDYVDGPEVAVEAIMQHGELVPIAVFDKPDPLEGPFFAETIYVTPSELPAERHARVLEVTAAGARALGLVHGPIHAELRVGGEPRLIEIAARSIGGLCSRALAHVLPCTLEALLLRHLGGERLRPPAAPGCASGVMMMPVRQSGILRRAHGLAEARAVAGVDAVSIAAQPGEAVRALPEGQSYLGFIFAHGDTPAAVTAALRRAEAETRLELSPLLALW